MTLRTEAESAFMPGPRVVLEPLRPGPLSGFEFAAKDLMDVAGSVKTSGNPDWARTHHPAAHTATVIDQLRSNGARLVGKTVTDELAFSLEGENIHYGTPLNPRCPDRLPGGSSSGSASAVASGRVDFALGTDTGGSIRVPSSFCGVFGMRPTHGRVPLAGVTPLGPTYDTLGWIGRNGETLAQVGTVLLGEGNRGPVPNQFTVITDAFAMVDPIAREALDRAVRALFGDLPSATLFDGHPEQWSEAYRVIVGAEAWAIHGPWITEVHPRFAPPIAERFRQASQIRAEEVRQAEAVREAMANRVAELLGAGKVLVIPSAPSVALPKDPTAREPLSGPFRGKAIALGTIAGHGGFPQVTLPVARAGGCPIGLSLVGSRGSDASLLALAASGPVRPLLG